MVRNPWLSLHDDTVLNATSNDQSWKRNNTLNVLYLTSFADYEQRMDRFLYDEIDAAIADERLNVTVWGHGWMRWDHGLSIEQNVRAVFGCDFFDVTLLMQATHPDEGTMSMPSCAPGVKSSTIVLFEIGDCFDLSGDAESVEQLPCLASIPAAADIVQTRYAHLLLHLFHPLPSALAGRPRLFTENGGCANRKILSPSPGQARYGVQLVGNTAEAFYPVRSKAAEAIKGDLIHQGAQRRHPGYTRPLDVQTSRQASWDRHRSR